MTFDQMLEQSALASPFANIGRLDMAAIFSHDIYAENEEDEAPPVQLPLLDNSWYLKRLDWRAFAATMDESMRDADRYAPLLVRHGKPFTPEALRAMPFRDAKVLLAAARIIAPLVPEHAPEVIKTGDGIWVPIKVKLAGEPVSFKARTASGLHSIIGVHSHAALVDNLLELAEGDLPEQLTPAEGVFLINKVAAPIIKAAKPLLKAVGLMEAYIGISLADLPLHTLHERFKHYNQALKDQRGFAAAIAGAKLKGSK